MNAVRRIIRPTHKTASDEPKGKSERESKENVQIISADTEALIEKICPHANATAKWKEEWAVIRTGESRPRTRGVKGKEKERKEVPTPGDGKRSKEPKPMEAKTEQTKENESPKIDVTLELGSALGSSHQNKPNRVAKLVAADFSRSKIELS